MPRTKKNYSRSKGKKFSKPNFKQKKTPNRDLSVNKRSKNFRFIQRSKEAEEFQRRQKVIEDTYKKQATVPTEEDDSENEDQVEEENAFESLLSTINKNANASKIIESSSEEEECPSGVEDSLDDSFDEEEEEILSPDGIEDNPDDSEEEDDEHVSKEEINKNEEIEDEENNVSDNELDIEDEEELDEEVEAEQSTKTDYTDPFTIQFDYELSQQHIDNLLNKPCPTKKSELVWPKLGKLQIEISKSGTNKSAERAQPPEKIRKVLIEEEQYAKEGCVPQLLTLNGTEIVKAGIKQQLAKNISLANKSFIKPDSKKMFTSLQSEVFSIISNYQDFSFPGRTLENAEEIRVVYCLHAMNHMLKTRTKVINNNAKLKAYAENKKTETLVFDNCRDQGLVRPKILIVLPFRDAAFKVVNILVDLLYGEKAEDSKDKGTVINYKRFTEEYTGNTLYFPKTNPKPEDYEKTFAGNTDDNFRIGMALTKKCIKLYTEFYSSDILIASPLGLRMVVGAPGDVERDYDFLNSIEILVLDQAELFLAQNWDHLLHVLDHMHLQPKSLRNTDFSRVRPWCLNGLSNFYRQTLLLTSHELPEFRSLFNSKCNNYRGKVRVVNPIVHGSIRNVFVQLSQIFHKIDVESVEASFDKRFKYFISEILPQFRGPSMAHCMVYVPSYFDYVRLRNYFKSETINFVQICEYTKDAKIARARDMFFHSAAHFLLYSERAHFFRRTRIKGIRHLIFYQPPCWAHFYPELMNLMQESCQNRRDGLETSMSVTVLYTKYDMMQVSGIIGTERAGKLLRGNKTTHVLMAGE